MVTGSLPQGLKAQSFFLVYRRPKGLLHPLAPSISGIPKRITSASKSPILYSLQQALPPAIQQRVCRVPGPYLGCPTL